MHISVSIVILSIPCNSLPQFSVTEHFRSGESGRMQALPGVFFFYDLSPIKVPSRCTLHLILYCRQIMQGQPTLLICFCFFYVRFAYSPSVMVNFGFAGNHCICSCLTCVLQYRSVIFHQWLLQVTFTEQHVSFLHFLTNVCAIVGGNDSICPFLFMLTNLSVMHLFC